MMKVIGVQTFDRLAVHSGGEDARVLPLDKLSMVSGAAVCIGNVGRSTRFCSPP